MTRRRIAVLYPAFNRGGAEGVCLWMLDALVRDHDVTLYTLTLTDFRHSDRMYGTALSNSGVRIAAPGPRVLTRATQRLFFHVVSLRAPRQHLLLRYFKLRGERHDLVISAYNEMDVGQTGMQYFHDPPRSASGAPVLHPISGYAEQRMRQNLTLVPSRFMADKLARAYDISPVVLHPPARSRFPERAWADREAGFVCVARMAPEKNVEDAVRLLTAVRARGHDIHLHLVTAGGKLRFERHLARVLRPHRAWIHVELNVDDARYRELLAAHRFGINAAPTEGFGVAIAELINAGCLPVVRGSGGQSEIFSGVEALGYADEADGVARVAALLSDEGAQQAARAQLADVRGRFTIERFCSELRTIVEGWFEEGR